MTLKRFSIGEFKGASQNKEDTSQAVLQKSHVGIVKAVGDEGDAVRSFVVSDASVDRDGDTIDQNGWELDTFNKSGVVLWAHDGSLPPIATPIKTFVEGGQLISHAKFAPQDMDHPLGMGFGHTVMRMFDEGLMKAVSAGFLPKEFIFNEERGGFMPTDFKRQELLEFSAVPVGSNRNALREARGIGINIDPLIAWAESARDGSNLLVPKSHVEEFLESATGETVTVDLAQNKSDDVPPTNVIDEDEFAAWLIDSNDKLKDEFLSSMVVSEDVVLEIDAEQIVVLDSDDRDDFTKAIEAMNAAEDEIVSLIEASVEKLTKGERAPSVDNIKRLADLFLIFAATDLKAPPEVLEAKKITIDDDFVFEFIDEAKESGIEIDLDWMKENFERIFAEKLYPYTGILPQ